MKKLKVTNWKKILHLKSKEKELTKKTNLAIKVIAVAILFLASLIFVDFLLKIEEVSASPITWDIEFVDTEDEAGELSSIALDSGDNPHIIYEYRNPSTASEELRYALKNGSVWINETVDSGKDFDGYMSIAVDSSDNPHICYYDVGSVVLKYAVNSSGIWVIEIVEIVNGGGARGGASISVDSNDNPHISYYDKSNSTIKYAIKSGGIWSIEIVDVGYDWSSPSIALDSNDNPHISYYDYNKKDLKYAMKSGGTWDIEIVDSVGDVGRYPSIALDSKDNPHISYYEDTSPPYYSGNLKYTTKINGTWYNETVDSKDKQIGMDTSIAIDSSDNVHISYWAATSGNLKYAMKNGSTWNIETADLWGGTGSFSSIAIDSNDNPQISYHYHRNGNDGDLKYAVKIPKPDLQVSTNDMRFDPSSPVANETLVLINVTIHNIGNIDAVGFFVRFYDGDPTFPIGTDQFIPEILAGGNIIVSVWWTALPIGVHNIYVVIDPDDAIEESNETNNIASKPLEVIDILQPTLYIKAVGDDVILNWTPPTITGLSHYLLYRSTSQTKFNFSNVWINTSQHEDNGTISLRTSWNDTGAGYNISPQQYYYTIRAVFKSWEISSTSRTVGKWTKTFPRGVSTFSLPLKPLKNMTIDNCLTDMNATYIRWMNTTTHTWMKHGDGGNNNTEIIVGEGCEVKFDTTTNYTFIGLPGAMISYDDDNGFAGFDHLTEVKSLNVIVEPNGDVNLNWQEPSSMGPGDYYEIYYSNTRDSFFGDLDFDYFQACPPVDFGTNTTVHLGAGANDPGARLYYMVVPFKASGVRGASTYSIGIWTEEYLSRYDTMGVPLKLEYSHSVGRFCDDIPNSVGINYFDYTGQRWCWHSTRMPEGAYDPFLEMTEGYQISTSNTTQFTFIGV
jgi:hypothetical protein